MSLDKNCLHRGQELKDASKAVILLHGRGASARSILNISNKLPEAAYFAPQAENNTWYPHPFMEPIEKNQPYINQSIERIEEIINQISDKVKRDRIVLAGFSQGACLASQYLVENPMSYGGGLIFSGGLIGSSLGKFNGSFDNTEIFIGCAENDPHIPLTRVNETANIFQDMNSDLEKYIFKGSSHHINDHELDQAKKLLNNI